jgi:hypothetical protein
MSLSLLFFSFCIVFVRLVLFQIFFKEDEEVSVGLGFGERGELVSDGKDVLPMLKKRLFGCDFDDGFEFALCRQERVSAKRRRRRGEVVVSNRGKSYPRGNRLGYRRVG